MGGMSYPQEKRTGTLQWMKIQWEITSLNTAKYHSTATKTFSQMNSIPRILSLEWSILNPLFLLAWVTALSVNKSFPAQVTYGMFNLRDVQMCATQPQGSSASCVYDYYDLLGRLRHWLSEESKCATKTSDQWPPSDAPANNEKLTTLISPVWSGKSVMTIATFSMAK